jgi:hypothetical protein
MPGSSYPECRPSPHHLHQTNVSSNPSDYDINPDPEGFGGFALNRTLADPTVQGHRGKPNRPTATATKETKIRCVIM